MFRRMRNTLIVLAGALGVGVATAAPALALSGINHAEPLFRSR